jgi:hypothetical protein
MAGTRGRAEGGWDVSGNTWHSLSGIGINGYKLWHTSC